MAALYELKRYVLEDGEIPFSEWLTNLDGDAAGRVQAYVDRMKMGNFGHCRSVGGGVTELKINYGPGYRVYYLRDGKALVILLCGGDKGTQRADIGLAHEFAADYWRRR